MTQHGSDIDWCTEILNHLSQIGHCKQNKSYAPMWHHYLSILDDEHACDLTLVVNIGHVLILGIEKFVSRRNFATGRYVFISYI